MSMIAVKLPNGKRIQRRFLRSSTLQVFAHSPRPRPRPRPRSPPPPPPPCHLVFSIPPTFIRSTISLLLVFFLTPLLQNLFDFIDAESDFPCPKYNVCTAFPRKVPSSSPNPFNFLLLSQSVSDFHQVFSEDMSAQTFELVGLVLPQACRSLPEL